MLIDCDACAGRGKACGECVVGLLFGVPPADRPRGPAAEHELDEVELRALRALTDGGLAPEILRTDVGHQETDREPPEAGHHPRLRAG